MENTASTGTENITGIQKNRMKRDEMQCIEEELR